MIKQRANCGNVFQRLYCIQGCALWPLAGLRVASRTLMAAPLTPFELGFILGPGGYTSQLPAVSGPLSLIGAVKQESKQLNVDTCTCGPMAEPRRGKDTRQEKVESAQALHRCVQLAPLKTTPVTAASGAAPRISVQE